LRPDFVVLLHVCCFCVSAPWLVQQHALLLL
jgi:hypothetical protein